MRARTPAVRLTKLALFWLHECQPTAAKKTLNPAITDQVQISEGQTEGSLGGRLAQRLAALREVMAKGHFQPLLASSVRAAIPLEHNACHNSVISSVNL